MAMDTDMEMDIGLDLELDTDFNSFNLDALPTDHVDFSFFDPLEETNSSANRPGTTAAEKPYHTKRPHKKSRAGCKACKSRKVKCDEARPACRNCRLRREECLYPASNEAAPSTPSLSKASRASSSRASKEPSPVPPGNEGCGSGSGALVVAEPQFRPSGMADDVDMKMLWFYTAEAFQSFSIESGRSPAVDRILKVKIVEHAFKSPFLMHCLMGLSALNLRHLNQPVPQYKVVSYQAQAFEGYRAAIEAAREVDYPALLACSLLMCALSSQMFREGQKKKLYIVDWMALWRGIGLIVEIISPQAVQDSGLALLFYRPPIDLEKSAQHIPNNLLFMVQSIGPDDSDYEYQQVYYETLKYLGSLYMELNHGFGPIFDLKVISWFTFIPKNFIPLAKEHRPRALIILAYYVCFAKMNQVWWMQGIEREIDEICDEVGAQWEHLLRIPKKVKTLKDKFEIGKTIVDNHNWTPEETDLYEKEKDPNFKHDIRFVDDAGREILIVNGKWVVKATGKLWEENKFKRPPTPTYLLGQPSFVTITDFTTETPSSGSASSDLSPCPQSEMSSLSDDASFTVGHG